MAIAALHVGLGRFSASRSGSSRRPASLCAALRIVRAIRSRRRIIWGAGANPRSQHRAHGEQQDAEDEFRTDADDRRAEQGHQRRNDNKAPATIIVVNHLRRVSSQEVVHPTLILHGELRCARGNPRNRRPSCSCRSSSAESKTHARINRVSDCTLDRGELAHETIGSERPGITPGMPTEIESAATTSHGCANYALRRCSGAFDQRP